MKFEAIVFDFDGTIGNSGISREVLTDWCEQLELDCGYHEIIEHVEQLPAEIQKEKTEGLLKLEREHMEKTDMLPGTHEWFAYIKEKGIKSAIFSRNTKRNIEVILKAQNIEVDLIMGRECSIPKPHPEGLEIIVEKLKLDKEKILMVGDSLISDVQVGQTVGVKTALVNFEGGSMIEGITPDYRWENLKEGYRELCT